MNEDEHPESQTHQLDSAHQAELAQRVEQEHQGVGAALTTEVSNQEDDDHQIPSEQPHPELPRTSTTNPPLGAPASEPVTTQDMVQEPQAQTSQEERNEFISSSISDIITAVTSKLDSEEEPKEKPGDAEKESEAAIATNDSKDSDEAMADEEATVAEEAQGTPGEGTQPESSSEAEAQIPSSVSPCTGGTQEEMASEEHLNQIVEDQQAEPETTPESCLQEIIEAYNRSSAVHQADNQTSSQDGDIATGKTEPSLDPQSLRMGPMSPEMKEALKNAEQALLKSATDKPVSGPLLKRIKPALNLFMNEMQARSQACEQKEDGGIAASTAQPQFTQALLQALTRLSGGGSQPEEPLGEDSGETHLPHFGEVQELSPEQIEQRMPKEALSVQDPGDQEAGGYRQAENSLSQPKSKIQAIDRSKSSKLVLDFPYDQPMAKAEDSSCIQTPAEESETSEEAMRILNYLKTLESQEKLEKEMRASGGLLSGNSPIQGPGSMAAGDSTSVRAEHDQAQASRSPPTITQQPTQTQLPSQPGAAASNQLGGNQAAATSSNLFLASAEDVEEEDQEEEDKDLGDEDTDDDEDDLIIVQADTEEYAELGTPTLETELETSTGAASGAVTTGPATGATAGRHTVARSNIQVHRGSLSSSVQCRQNMTSNPEAQAFDKGVTSSPSSPAPAQEPPVAPNPPLPSQVQSLPMPEIMELPEITENSEVAEIAEVRHGRGAGVFTPAGLKKADPSAQSSSADMRRPPLNVSIQKDQPDHRTSRGNSDQENANYDFEEMLGGPNSILAQLASEPPLPPLEEADASEERKVQEQPGTPPSAPAEPSAGANSVLIDQPDTRAQDLKQLFIAFRQPFTLMGDSKNDLEKFSRLLDLNSQLSNPKSLCVNSWSLVNTKQAKIHQDEFNYKIIKAEKFQTLDQFVEIAKNYGKAEIDSDGCLNQLSTPTSTSPLVNNPKKAEEERKAAALLREQQQAKQPEMIEVDEPSVIAGETIHAPKPVDTAAPTRSFPSQSSLGMTSQDILEVQSQLSINSHISASRRRASGRAPG